MQNQQLHTVQILYRRGSFAAYECHFLRRARSQKHRESKQCIWKTLIFSVTWPWRKIIGTPYATIM